MYQPAAPVVQFSQAPPQPAPVIQIMQQPQMPTYPQPPIMMAAPAPETKNNDGRETYRPNSGSGRGLKIFLIVGIVGAALVACIIVGVVVGVLMTTTTGDPRTPCDDIAEQTIGALPYRFTNISLSECVYGYYWDGVCMYDGHFDADNGCYGKDYGADLIAGRCYYNGESTCHCSTAYRKDENLCYNFAINLTNSLCSNGLITKKYCLYDKRGKSTRGECSAGWDKVGEKYCYMRKRKICDDLMDNGIARKNCLKGESFVRKRYT